MTVLIKGWFNKYKANKQKKELWHGVPVLRWETPAKKSHRNAQRDQIIAEKSDPFTRGEYQQEDTSTITTIKTPY